MSETVTEAEIRASHDHLDHKVSGEVVIKIEKMNKWYGDFHVLRDVDLTVRRGERIVICGPSGSGKSTTIRCINRLEEHQQGRIVVDGVELNNDVKNIEAIRREVGMVFQHFNLFPHLTVLENCVLAPIWVRKEPRKLAEERAMHYLERVKIPDQAKKYPGQLSGGQQRRAHQRPGSGNDQGSARHHGDPGRGRHDHALRDPRNGLRQNRGRPGDLHGPGTDRGGERAPRVLQQPPERADQAVPEPDPGALTRKTGHAPGLPLHHQ
jgi:general L-amino acid transport system ATP-binding protein